MALKFLATTFTPSVRAAQSHYYGRAPKLPPAPETDTLTADETDFLAARDSFYMATVTEDGWPYVQHRGGPPGFLKVLGPNQLASPTSAATGRSSPPAISPSATASRCSSWTTRAGSG
jgi:hypothetical protein